MATYTPNFNLSKPENTDTQSSFISDYCGNMDIIDANLGGGGGGSSVFLNTIYSDTEKKIGYWRDNKPLYQKTLIFQNAQRGRVDNLPHNISDVDFIFVESWEFKQSTSGIIGFENTNSSYWANLFQITSTAISYRIGESWGVGDLYVNVRYTKTTDTPELNPQFGNVIYLPTIYSDEERQVGVWRDNKPLYQKTFIATLNNIPNDTATNVADISGLNIDEVADISGRCNYYNGANWFNVDFSTYYAIYAYTNGYLQFKQKMTNATVDRVYELAITLRYTKTTDTAGSGNWNTDGIPTHHYSTNEQVIGTWIDGKPIYERTWDFGSDFNMGNPNTWYPTTISISANNIKRVIAITSAFSSVGTLWDNLGVAININDYVQLNSSRNTGGEAVQYLTLRYTKTTD